MSWRGYQSWRSRACRRRRRALLNSVLTGPLDPRVRDQIVAEARGNPLALLELPRGFSPAELAGGFGLPGAGPVSGSIEDSFRRRLDALPADTCGSGELLCAGDVVAPESMLRFVIPVENLGSEVEPVRPDNSPGFMVYADLSEVLRIVQGSDHRSLGLPRDVLHVSHHTVVKEQTHHVRPKNSDADN